MDREGGGGVLTHARLECERRLERGDSLGAVERYIDGLQIDSERRDALWLWAWAWGEPPRRPTQARRRDTGRLIQ